MSSLTILGDTSGSVVLQAPAIAGSSTITLPTTGGTVRTTTTPGTILQVQSLTITNAISISGATMTWYDLPGVSITITPTNASSKFYLMANLQVGRTSFSSYFRFAGGNSGNFIGDAASNRPRVGAASSPSDDTYSGQNILALGMVYLDSPATASPITYKVQCAPQVDFRTVYVNRSGSDRDATNYDPRTASSFTIMEIAA